MSHMTGRFTTLYIARTQAETVRRVLAGEKVSNRDRAVALKSVERAIRVCDERHAARQAEETA